MCRCNILPRNYLYVQLSYSHITIVSLSYSFPERPDLPYSSPSSTLRRRLWIFKSMNDWTFRHSCQCSHDYATDAFRDQGRNKDGYTTRDTIVGSKFDSCRSHRSLAASHYLNFACTNEHILLMPIVTWGHYDYVFILLPSSLAHQVFPLPSGHVHTCGRAHEC
jgi:hypothetical protein